jgi:probable rRNA maturation factor
MSTISIQIACSSKDIPSSALLRKWAKHVLSAQQADGKEITIRLVDSVEIQQLNATYRHKDKPTNVLSFPMDAPPGVQAPILGDIILCADVISQEAEAQGKPATAHWAHMIVHGILHLLGFDHIEDKDAIIMESREVALLQSLGFPDPYGEHKTV